MGIKILKALRAPDLSDFETQRAMRTPEFVGFRESEYLVDSNYPEFKL